MDKLPEKDKQILKDRRFWLALLAILGLAFGLAWSSNGFDNIAGFLGFFALLALAALRLLGGWQQIRDEGPPRWLATLVVFSVLLRLALGLFWTLGLPVWGYDTDVQQAGYFMKDAYQRDGIAWRLAQSEENLFSAFSGYSETDQYGGVLFLSGLVYRYFGGDVHQPMMVVVVAAAFSSLALFFTWTVVKRLWGEGAAKTAVWLLALYPDAVLLGSVQMREAFLIPLVVMGIYYLQRLWDTRVWSNLAWLAGVLLFGAAISLPFAAMLLFTLIAIGIALGREYIFTGKRGWVVSIGLVVVAVAAAWVMDQSFHWVQQAIRWQAYSSERVSGRLALMFESMPKWAQMPFLTGYGVFRPLLPSALFDDSIPVWRVVAIWRALGWTILLVLLFYATYMAFKARAWRKLPGILLIVNWIVVAVSSFRGGGDLWDNPRYRVTFAGIQVALAAWGLARQKETKDPWLRRGIGMTLMMLAWFGPWYVQRKFFDLHWQIWELGDLVGLGLASGVLYLVWDWVREQPYIPKKALDDKSD